MEIHSRMLYLEEWDNHSNIFLWNKNSGILKKMINNKKSIDGFLKKHLIGKNIIIFKKNNQWVLSFENDTIALEDIYNIKIKYFPFAYLMSFEIKDKRYNFFDFNFFNFFARSYDPTYDYFDKKLIFGEWLNQLPRMLKPNQKITL